MIDRGPIDRYAVLTPFDNPDEYFAFCDSYAEDLITKGLEGFRRDGRGVVLLRKRPGPFVEVVYATFGPEDLDALTVTGRSDIEDYDPERELLVGIAGEGRRVERFWLTKVVNR